MAAPLNISLRTNKIISFPESIDSDRGGNLYFSEIFGGSLYRIRRNSDKTLNTIPELVVSGFKSAHGISIDRENNHIYFGVQIKEGINIIAKIISFSLDIFDHSDYQSKLPIDHKQLKKISSQSGFRWLEWELPKNANGVVYSNKTNSVFYTFHQKWSNLPLINLKGHLGKISIDNQQGPTILKKFVTPNGLDIDPSDQDIIIVAFSSKNSVGRYSLQPGIKRVDDDEISMGEGGRLYFRHSPDGLVCTEKGDIFVACFASGKILFFTKQGSTLKTPPTPIKEGLGCPTDLVIGQSSNGSGKSIYITTMKPLFKGRVEEIQIPL